MNLGEVFFLTLTHMNEQSLDKWVVVVDSDAISRHQLAVEDCSVPGANRQLCGETRFIRSGRSCMRSLQLEIQQVFGRITTSVCNVLREVLFDVFEPSENLVHFTLPNFFCKSEGVR